MSFGGALVEVWGVSMDRLVATRVSIVCGLACL